MIHYIFQIIAFQLLFLVVYDLLLKNETFFQSNRLYLIATPLLSLGLPLLEIPVLQRAIPEEFAVQLPAVLIGGAESTSHVVLLEELTIYGISGPTWTLFDAVLWIWIIGACICLVSFLRKIVKILKLRRLGSHAKVAGVAVILLPETDLAFSFFNNIFLGSELSDKQRASIILHERIHIEQRHTLDMLFFEMQRILFWFNPLVYVFQNRMELLQEFIADANVARQKNKKEYYQDLLSQVFKTESISFINTFFNHSLIKKRISMLQKSKSKSAVQLRYLLLLPLICGMLIYTACTDSPAAEEKTTSQQYVSGSDESEIIQRVNDLLEAVAKKGEISKEEEDAIKSLNVLTSDEGVDHQDFEEVKDMINLPIGVLDKVPTFPGCSGDNEALKSCLSQKIAGFVGENFNTKVGGKEISGKQRIVVNFKIDISGRATEVKAKAAFPALETEAERVIALLPKMEPGVKEGKTVGVMYALPIIFDIKSE